MQHDVTAFGEEHDLPAAPDRFLDRELSWLAFNERVLDMAADQTIPLLERVNFLSIFASNLDEFFMVRVAGLKRRISTGLAVTSVTGTQPRATMKAITQKASALARRHADLYRLDIRPRLEAEDIHVVGLDDLTEAERTSMARLFEERVFPVLTPLAVDPAHPFPYISGLSLNLAVTVADPDAGLRRFARVKVPDNVARLIRVEEDRADERATFLPLEDLIAAHLENLFPGMEVIEHHIFRVTRNADLEVEEDRDEDLLQAMERELARRRFGPPVRLEVTESMTEHMLELLLRELEVDRRDVVEVKGLLDPSCLFQLD